MLRDIIAVNGFIISLIGYDENLLYDTSQVRRIAGNNAERRHKEGKPAYIRGRAGLGGPHPHAVYTDWYKFRKIRSN